MSLKIYNVLTHKKEEFQPLEPGRVKMYACGITVSGDAHIGHAYQSVVFDMITRYLMYKGYAVTYARNYTDVDDKIIAAAQQTGEDPIKFAERFINKTDAEIAALGSLTPTLQPRATTSMNDIIDFVEKLVAKGNAYATPSGDVYFSVKSFHDYGKLSRIQVNENEVAVRKDLEPDKKDPADFALWKSAKPGEISWESPWGMGRPGWHIECSAMNLANLGEQIDIHGGGRDLIFPHHENEIAQTEALTGKKFANFWIHCGLVKINGQKMSKSLGNGITIQEMLEKYDSDTIRFALLRNTYASDIDVNDNFFAEAQNQIQKMYSTLAKVQTRNDNIDNFETDKLISELTTEFEAAMDDNFNTAATFAVMFKYFKLINKELVKPESSLGLIKLSDKIRELMAVFNVLQQNPIKYTAQITETDRAPADVQKLADERAMAKAARDWGRADALRDQISAAGWNVVDTPDGAKLVKNN